MQSAPTAYSIWVAGDNDVWLGGSATWHFDGALSHWDGATWTPVPDQDESYNSLWGSAPNDLYAVGDLGIVAHWNGSKWSASRELEFHQSFTMVHGSSATNVWATAVDRQALKGMVLHLKP